MCTSNVEWNGMRPWMWNGMKYDKEFGMEWNVTRSVEWKMGVFWDHVAPLARFVGLFIQNGGIINIVWRKIPRSLSNP